MFVAALAAILGDYSKQVVDYVADPRTGTITEFPNGLPNVGQIREFCNATAKRADTLAKPKPRTVAVPFVPPPIKPGQVDFVTFLKSAELGKTYPRPIGPFERVDDKWNKNLKMKAGNDDLSFNGAEFEAANRRWFEKECAKAGVDPAAQISPSLSASLKR